MPLPSLHFAHSGEIGTPAKPPFLDHLGPRDRILTKQPRKLACEHQGSQLDVGIGFRAGLYVVLWRFQGGVGAMRGISETFEQDLLQVVGVENFKFGIGSRENFRETAPQEWEFKIRRDS